MPANGSPLHKIKSGISSCQFGNKVRNNGGTNATDS